MIGLELAGVALVGFCAGCVTVWRRFRVGYLLDVWEAARAQDARLQAFSRLNRRQRRDALRRRRL